MSFSIRAQGQGPDPNPEVCGSFGARSSTDGNAAGAADANKSLT
jgi:hypothetical protein